MGCRSPRSCRCCSSSRRCSSWPGATGRTTRTTTRRRSRRSRPGVPRVEPSTSRRCRRSARPSRADAAEPAPLPRPRPSRAETAEPRAPADADPAAEPTSRRSDGPVGAHRLTVSEPTGPDASRRVAEARTSPEALAAARGGVQEGLAWLGPRTRVEGQPARSTPGRGRAARPVRGVPVQGRCHRS